MNRPTEEEIKEKAESHVVYGWARSPGTHRRDIVWTAEDTVIYNKYFDEFYAARKGRGLASGKEEQP